MKIDQLFSKIEKEEEVPSSLELQERYYYFIYKWRELFQKYLKNPKEPLDISYEYSKEELAKQYLIEKDFKTAYTKLANTIYLSTKFKEVTPSMRYVYTIDGKGAVELDDGFSCTKVRKDVYKLGIHITNPLSYIKEDSLLFQQASRRASSVYLPHTMIPLFPMNLATDLFSLNKNNVRNCVSFYIVIDLKKQEITKFKPTFEQVFVRGNYTYTESNQILKSGTGDRVFRKTLENTQAIIPFLNQFYKMDTMYKKIKRSKTNPTSTNIIGSTKSEKIVETLMVFINHYYADFAIKNKIPCLFRNHEQTPFYKEYLEKYIEIFQKEKKNQIYTNELKILKSLYPSSFYDITNKGHHGIGVNAYTHVTSPDRRIADDYNILMLQKHMGELKKQERELLEVKLKRIGDYINARNRSIDSFVSDYAYLTKKHKNRIC